MPRFYFHLAGQGTYSRDDEGATFADLDAAYLDACQAALDMSFAMLQVRRDPNFHRFEIADESGAVVLDLPFTEVLRPHQPALPRWAGLLEVVHAGMARNKTLRTDLVEAIAAAQKTLEETRQLLSR